MATTDPLANVTNPNDPLTGTNTQTGSTATSSQTTQQAPSTTQQPQPAQATPTASPTAAAVPDQYKAPDIKPVATQVNPEKETVQGQLSNILQKGNAYTELARRDTMREANARGLINSTMAAGRGEEAAIRSALPIAQQDAKTYYDTRTTNQAQQNEFLKNQQSANLNIEVAAVDNQLKTNFEKTMQDARFSDQAKTEIVQTVNNIVRDTQQQIATIGTSDRSAEQQAAAIKTLESNRDAQLAVYQDLLGTFNDWNWGMNFTPGESQIMPTAPATVQSQQYSDINNPPSGSTISQGISRISSDGKWLWNANQQQWTPTQ